MLEKIVCLKSSYGNIDLTFNTALSLLLEQIQIEYVYSNSNDNTNHMLDLVNMFVELGKNEKNIIDIEYIPNNDVNNVLYLYILKGMISRVETIEENL